MWEELQSKYWSWKKHQGKFKQNEGVKTKMWRILLSSFHYLTSRRKNSQTQCVLYSCAWGEQRAGPGPASRVQRRGRCQQNRAEAMQCGQVGDWYIRPVPSEPHFSPQRGEGWSDVSVNHQNSSHDCRLTKLWTVCLPMVRCLWHVIELLV